MSPVNLPQTASEHEDDESDSDISDKGKSNRINIELKSLNLKADQANNENCSKDVFINSLYLNTMQTKPLVYYAVRAYEKSLNYIFWCVCVRKILSQ